MKMLKFKEIIKKARSVGLRPAEKSEIRARLYAVAVGVQSPKSKVQSFGWQFFRPVPILASLMIALLLGGGVSLASEGALPGDLLYPIKVGINEEIRSKLALSVEAKAGWEAQRAERRLVEAEKLSADGQLTDEKQVKIEEAFDKHAIAAQGRATAKIAAKIEIIARKHEKIIARINKKTEIEPAAASLMADVSTEAVAAKVQAHEETRSAQEITLEFAADLAMRSAENKISEFQNFANEEMLKIAAEAIVEGKVKLEKKLYGEAVILFRKAHKLAQESQKVLNNEEVEGGSDGRLVY